MPVNIRGKEYLTVAERIQDVRTKHPAWSITTDVQVDGDRVLARCTIADDGGRVIATGTAEEFRTASAINKTSAVENAETSAVGRALAFAGWGGAEIASADEVLHAIRQQQEPAPAPQQEVSIASHALKAIRDAEDVPRLLAIDRRAFERLADFSPEERLHVFTAMCGKLIELTTDGSTVAGYREKTRHRIPMLGQDLADKMVSILQGAYTDAETEPAY